MPLYSLKCVVCGRVEDVVLPSYKSENPRCGCGGETRRQIAAPADPQFRGKGFFRTDYPK